MSNSQKQALALAVIVTLEWMFATFSDSWVTQLISGLGLIVAYAWFLLVTPSERSSRPVSYVQSRISEGLRRAQTKGK